jgi:hypothetical protein
MSDLMPLCIIFIKILNKMHGLVIIVGILIILLLRWNRIFEINLDDGHGIIFGIVSC